MPSWRELSFPLKGDDVGAVFEKGEKLCVALADGVGSYSGGRAAALRVIDVVRSRVDQESELNYPALFAECKKALAEQNDGLRMGTTLTVVEVVGRVARFAHVGDCRVYHLRGNGLKTVTSDQTEVAYLLSKGVINKYEARQYPRANVLMSVVAPDKEFKLQEGEFTVLPGDRFLICTDGFYKAISKQRIRDLSIATREFGGFVDRLGKEVSNSERDDDATAFMVEI